MRGATLTCPKCATEMPVAFSFCGKCGARLLALAPVGGETKQVTVLFADISGFTALAERLGPEELHENMRAAWDAIAVEIRASGGLIEKYIGDAVVAVFGAVDNEVDHPARAQRAALSCQHAPVEPLVPVIPEAIAVRVNRDGGRTLDLCRPVRPLL